MARLEGLIAATDTLTKTKRAELRGAIGTKPGPNRYLRVTAGGLLRVDAKAITAEEKLDGKHLLRSNEPRCPPRTSRWHTSSCSGSNAAGVT